jgi:4-diphosphocytidyl-2-C-methyl-D-erythritol kinase
VTATEELVAVAPAKINWTLEVIGRRDDGYHEIRSVLQTISIVDSLYARPAPALSLDVHGQGAAELATDENLVLRAAQALGEATQRKPCVAFRLVKRIPASAGLGGGSSDAAATLRLLCRLWRIRDAGLVHRVAASIGSDVPFFLRGGLQCAAGRGERLRPLDLPDPLPVQHHLVLIRPPATIAQKTARLFAQLTPDHYSTGDATEALVAKCRDGSPPGVDDYVNVFDQVADAVFPDVPFYRRVLEEATGARALLAGAGPTLFAVCRDLPAAADANRRLEEQGFEALTAVTTNLVSDPCGL